MKFCGCEMFFVPLHPKKWGKSILIIYAPRSAAERSEAATCKRAFF